MQLSAIFLFQDVVMMIHETSLKLLQKIKCYDDKKQQQIADPTIVG